jgi:hypothetical protein
MAGKRLFIDFGRRPKWNCPSADGSEQGIASKSLKVLKIFFLFQIPSSWTLDDSPRESLLQLIAFS